MDERCTDPCWLAQEMLVHCPRQTFHFHTLPTQNENAAKSYDACSYSSSQNTLEAYLQTPKLDREKEEMVLEGESNILDGTDNQRNMDVLSVAEVYYLPLPTALPGRGVARRFPYVDQIHLDQHTLILVFVVDQHILDLPRIDDDGVHELFLDNHTIHLH